MTLRSFDEMRQLRMIVKNGNWKNNLFQNPHHVGKQQKKETMDCKIMEIGIECCYDKKRCVSCVCYQLSV